MKRSKKHHPYTDEALVRYFQQPIKDEVAGDCLIELRNRYLPMIKGMTAKYFAQGMDYDDWLQESLCVMIKCARRYSPRYRVKFCSFFRNCLQNWFNDLIRKQGAKKRVPSNCLTSYNANQVYYDDVLGDVKAIHPERFIVMAESLKSVLHHCSRFETTVILSIIIRRQSFASIAKQHQCSISKVKNAFARCKVKFRNLQERGLN